MCYKCREISFSCVLSNLIKLCYVYGEHLHFEDYGGFQILGLLRRNGGGKINMLKERRMFGFAFSRMVPSPIGKEFDMASTLLRSIANSYFY